MAVRLTARIDADVEDIARSLEDEPEEVAGLLSWLARLLDPEARDAMGAELLCMPDGDRKTVRDFALMIAGACGEDE